MELFVNFSVTFHLQQFVYLLYTKKVLLNKKGFLSGLNIRNVPQLQIRLKVRARQLERCNKLVFILVESIHSLCLENSASTR